MLPKYKTVTKFKKGNAWCLNWREGNTRFRPSLGVIPEAEAERRRRIKELELNTDQPVVLEGSGMVLNNFIDEYLVWHAGEYPDSNDRICGIFDNHILPEFGDIPMDLINIRLTDNYKTERRKHVKIATINKELQALKAALNKAVDWEYLVANPIQRMRYSKNIDSKPPRFYELDELKLIYSLDTETGHWWKFMANTGLRRGEALNQSPRHVGRDEMRILSDAGKRTKSGKWREVPLSPGAQDARAELPMKGDRLFPKMAPRSFSRRFERVLEKAEFADPGSMHSLRHSFCSHLVMSGQSLRTVQILAGHANIKTTEKYAHLTPGFLKESITLLNI